MVVATGRGVVVGVVVAAVVAGTWRNVTDVRGAAAVIRVAGAVVVVGGTVVDVARGSTASGAAAAAWLVVVDGRAMVPVRTIRAATLDTPAAIRERFAAWRRGLRAAVIGRLARALAAVPRASAVRRPAMPLDAHSASGR